jgi:hypothetical protein
MTEALEIVKAAGFDLSALTKEQVEIFAARIQSWRERFRAGGAPVHILYLIRGMSESERAMMRRLVEENQ